MAYKEGYDKVYVVNAKSIFEDGVGIADGPNLDSFSRLRVSSPQGIFDTQLTYDLRPLQYQRLTNGTGATIAHDSTNRCATMTFADTPTGGYAYMQSYEYIPYQPGRSQLAFVTFNFIETKANVLKFAGLSDRNNGFEFQIDGSTPRFVLYSDTTNGDQIVNQSAWNLDKLDGTGNSRKTIDLTKVQILVIDFQALYVGRVRMGFDIDGQIIYAHEFNHAERIATPYIQTATLPVRCGMSCTGTVSTTMRFVCSAVISEGGQEDTAGNTFTAEGTKTAANGSRTHLLSIQPKLTFNSITNRMKFVLDSIEFISTGADPIKWELVLGQAISGTTTFTDVDTTYSAMEYNTAGTISGSPGIVIAAGYIASSATTRGSVSAKVAQRYPITLAADGTLRADNFGRMTILVTGLGGNVPCRASFNWREIR